MQATYLGGAFAAQPDAVMAGGSETPGALPFRTALSP
jgi:hypothetical protein